MIPWLVALAIVLLYLSYSLGVRHGLQFGQRERKTLRDGLEAARRQLSEIAPFEGPIGCGVDGGGVVGASRETSSARSKLIVGPFKAALGTGELHPRNAGRDGSSETSAPACHTTGWYRRPMGTPRRIG